MFEEADNSFNAGNFLGELRSRISARKRRFQDQANQRWYPDIFAEKRSRLLTKDDLDSNPDQADIRRVLRVAFDRHLVGGEYSPLTPGSEMTSPNEENLTNYSLYFEWSSFEHPFYLPKICSCETKNEKLFQKYYCENEKCEGLFEIPYSLIQVYLNRTINSIDSFVSEVKSLPNSLVIYYGKLRNSIVIVINDKEQEKAVIKSLSYYSLEIGCISIYQVSKSVEESNKSYSAKLKFRGFPNDKALNSL
ncbi:hypothetical protein FG386_001225 [Cryptosporidium ryanae]|uniref:uncharacterized protein n=1 Tax=Cryptosporidium ryanae TaxID=515981 RepID=UPI003519F0BD|nr:hypothetical protein FG386_001225 [Cryptosporidium ryanae]